MRGERNKASTRDRRVWAQTLCLLLAVLLLQLSIGCSKSDGTEQSGTSETASAYQPQVGDVLFQSSRPTDLVQMIEGVSQSPYSHCAIVGKEDGRWVVYEALGTVSITPLDTFLARGRGGGFAAYRLREPFRKDIPEIMSHTRAFLGRPYDFRYRLDDEHIYCSELIYKAFLETTGKPLGRLDALGDLNWRPYEAQIEALEKGPVPLDREMITPRGLAEAEQLERVYAYHLGSPDAE